MVASLLCTVAVAVLAVAAVGGEAGVVEHTFVVHEMNVTHLCNTTKIFVVNGQLPGPTVDVTEGDTVVIHVVNKIPHGLTIHWHGVRQLRSCWADGAGFITECPIPPGSERTYRFNVTDQVGTLWWHAHVTCLRSTINGAFIIRPRDGKYPFPTPVKDVPIIIGEWWELDLVELDRRMRDGNFDDNPLSATINGKLGDLSNCSGIVEESFVLNVKHGESYLLRVINTAFFSEYYFKVAGHTFTVVGADGNYLTPFKTDMVTVAPGEAIDVLMVADAPPAHYHMIALANQPPEPDPQIPKYISRGLVRYTGVDANNNGLPVPMPIMPNQHNTMPSYYFHANLTGLMHPKHRRVPMHVDERIFIILGLGTICRGRNTTCKRQRSLETIEVATMNNVSFTHPNTTALLERYYDGTPEGVYTEDFPVRPPRPYNYTNPALIPPGPLEEVLEPTFKATKLKRFKGLAASTPRGTSGSSTTTTLSSGTPYWFPAVVGPPSASSQTIQGCGTCTVTLSSTSLWAWRRRSSWRMGQHRRRACLHRRRSSRDVMPLETTYPNNYACTSRSRPCGHQLQAKVTKSTT
ncbi:laccase-20 isoform X3 [Oryza sativa Japonica Group]|uniref:laccase-20 isoform X3 n=1 Tax=Oryza sativa subsp. japonica TaxID=39947 RepID=UPI0029198C9E|nr:hypothetical protein DAI22_11g211800 [Oryza sativa Japonica Group]